MVKLRLCLDLKATSCRVQVPLQHKSYLQPRAVPLSALDRGTGGTTKQTLMKKSGSKCREGEEGGWGVEPKPTSNGHLNVQV